MNAHAESLVQMFANEENRIAAATYRLLEATRWDTRRAIHQATCWASNEDSRAFWLAVVKRIESAG